MSFRTMSRNLAVSLVTGVLASPAVSTAVASETEDTFAVVFEGKGTRLGWDLGVMQAAMSDYPAIASSKTIVAGNSSGAIFTSFFACHGVNQESLDKAKELLLDFDRGLVNDTENLKKILKLLRGKPTEFPHSNMDPVIEKITNNGDCSPQQPMIIAALNAEIMNNQQPRKLRPGHKLFQGKDEKTMNYDNFSIYMKDKYLGRACTYFVDPIMYNRLSQMNRDERLCDLRLVEDAADMKVAILASISEPTYFPIVEEKDLGKLQITEDHDERVRYYGGGMVMPAVTQDVRRVFPEAYLLGTGRNYPTELMVRIARAFYLVDPDHTMRLGKWWHDMEVVPAPEVWRSMALGRFSSIEEFNLGKQNAEACLKTNGCRPVGAIKPAFTTAVCIEGELCSNQELVTGRGLPTKH